MSETKGTTAALKSLIEKAQAARFRLAALGQIDSAAALQREIAEARAVANRDAYRHKQSATVADRA